MTDSLIDPRGAVSDFRIGQVFSRAWTVFKRNFLVFMAISLIVSLPLLLAGGAGVGVRPDQAGLIAGSAGLLWIVFNMVGQAVIVSVAFQSLRGQRARVGEAVGKGLARFFPIIGLLLVYLVLLIVWAFLIGGVSALSFQSTGILRIAGVGVAILLVVLGGVMFTWWAVALPACVVERLGPIASLGRSARLTKGHRWAVFAICLLVIIAVTVIGIVLGIILRLVFGLGFGVGQFSVGLMVMRGGTLIWNALWIAYYDSMLIMIYHDLRAAKEGTGTDQIAAVFD
ncbi:MAG: hypothetical protein ACLPKB_01300 [Xanthobacteraceae bacterium]